MTFPSPVGGITLEQELIPCIIFSVSYGVLSIFYIFQQFKNRNAVTACISGTGGFVVERYARVIWLLQRLEVDWG